MMKNKTALKHKKWSEEEVNKLIARVVAKDTLAMAAETLGRSVASVSRKWEGLSAEKKANAAPVPLAPLDPLEKSWKEEAKKANERVKGLTKQLSEAADFRALARELAPKKYAPSPKIVNKYDASAGKRGSAQSAVLLLSDCHIGKVVTPDQTLDFGNYSFDIFLRRLARLQRSVVSILSDHTTTKINSLNIAMLGDMLDGALIHSVECGQVNTLFDQFYAGGHAIAQFVRAISAVVPEVNVVTAVGNHPRFAGSQPKMPTYNVYSNLDQFLYAYIAALLGDEGNIHFHLNKQPFARFEVEGWVFLAMHGTHLRGGDRILGIPAHSVGRNISAHSQLAARAGQELPNYYCAGHLHRQIELPHALGDFMFNGAFPGVDGFGLAEAFNSARPSQKFFLVHPKFGRTACYDLFLDLGDTEEHNYTLPEDFTCQ